MPTEEEPAGGLWMLTYEDGFASSWFPFYAPSQEEAMAYAQELIEQLPYKAINTKLQAYPGSSKVVFVVNCAGRER